MRSLNSSANGQDQVTCCLLSHVFFKELINNGSKVWCQGWYLVHFLKPNQFLNTLIHLVVLAQLLELFLVDISIIGCKGFLKEEVFHARTLVLTDIGVLRHHKVIRPGVADRVCAIDLVDRSGFTFSSCCIVNMVSPFTDVKRDGARALIGIPVDVT